MFFGGDPFEHFAGMHGGPGGGSRRSAAPPRDVDTTKLYETLGVSLSFLSFLFYRCSVSICYICMWGTIISATWLCFGYDVIFTRDKIIHWLPSNEHIICQPAHNKIIQYFDMILHLSVCRPSRIVSVTSIIQTNFIVHDRIICIYLWLWLAVSVGVFCVFIETLRFILFVYKYISPNIHLLLICIKHSYAYSYSFNDMYQTGGQECRWKRN